MADQLTHEQRKALYAARKGKKQSLPVTLVFQSSATQTLKNKADESKVIKMRTTATAVRGDKNKYEAVQHPPKVTSVSRPASAASGAEVITKTEG